MRFYLGSHQQAWLNDSTVPLFVSHRRLARQEKVPRATHGWALDSGAFSEVAQFGKFTTSPAEYIAAIRRYREEIGMLEWAAPQDHMTEAFILNRSELASTVVEAQQWTVANYLTLRGLDSTLPIIPVLQGQSQGDYERHVEMYDRAGINLERERRVGLGSVCRRQATAEIGTLVALLSRSLRLHGFGVKLSGLKRYGWCLDSADSMAWCFAGSKIKPCPVRGVKTCSNCRHFALEFRERVLRNLETQSPVQLGLL